MDRSQFSQAAPGRLIELPNGPSGTRISFLPDPLPPKWAWPQKLWPVLLEARVALASLDGTGKHLPNPAILIRPLQAREAQLSSRLEGTVTDPRQQVLFDADPQYPSSVHDPVNAYREVWNYSQALRLRLDGSSDLPLSLRLIKQLHSQLMEGVRGSDPHPGEFRTIQNQIDSPPRFVPPPPQHLQSALADFEAFLHRKDVAFDPLVRCFLAHYQFEAIHPFRDGNGRVGRLLLALTITEWCGLSSQWLYMSAYFEKKREEYLDLLLRVSTEGDWENWIRFCLEGVVHQAADTGWRCDRLLSLHRVFHDRLKGGSVRLSHFVDSLFSSPVITVNRYRKNFGVTYPTAKRDLQRLESEEIVSRLGEMKQITYYCKRIYDIAYGELED